MIKEKKRPKQASFFESLAMVLIDINIVDIYGKKNKKERDKGKERKTGTSTTCVPCGLLHVCTYILVCQALKV